MNYTKCGCGGAYEWNEEIMEMQCINCGNIRTFTKEEVVGECENGRMAT